MTDEERADLYDLLNCMCGASIDAALYLNRLQPDRAKKARIRREQYEAEILAFVERLTKKESN